MFAGDEPRGQEGDSTAVQIPCKILSRRRRRRIDTRYYAATFLPSGKKLFTQSFRVSLSLSLSLSLTLFIYLAISITIFNLLLLFSN